MSEFDSLRRNPMAVSPDSVGSKMPETTTATPHPDHLAPKNDLMKDVVSAPPNISGARGMGGC